MLLAARPCAFALDPSVDISQYAHTSWKIRDGFTSGNTLSIAQTPDGYLWLGTEFGLVRFDGVRTVPWQPPPDQHLPSDYISSLLAARDGTLWIGTRKGLASWKDGKLTHYPELAGIAVFTLLEDRDDTVWAGGGGSQTGRLCAIQNGSIHCNGEDGTLGSFVVGLYEDSRGNLWAGVLNGLWRWKPGTSSFYPIPNSLDSIHAFGEDNNGMLLVSTRTGMKRLVDGKVEAYSFPGTTEQFEVQRLLSDREGGLWIGTRGRGLMHVHQGRTDVFSQLDGLSGDNILGLFEDREGNIWVATANGLDHFRDFAVTTFDVKQGLSNPLVYSVLADRDGSVWLSTQGGLNRWDNGRITLALTGGRKPDGRLNGELPTSLYQDSRGRVWVPTVHGVGYLEKDRFVPVDVPAGPGVHSIAEDNAGNLWIADQQHGLLRLSPRSDVQQIPWAGLGRKDYGTALAVDALRGGLWIGFSDGGIAYFADAGIRESYTEGSGLGEGRVTGIQFDHQGTLWVATVGGLSRLKNGSVATLTTKNGLPCDTVHSVIDDDAGSYWLNMPCGLVRVAYSELDTWAATVDKDKRAKSRIQATIFDSSDGIRREAFAGGYAPKVAKSRDGRLWFRGVDGVGVIDPHHLPSNKLPPPVHIEQITADHKNYDLTSTVNGYVCLPPRIRDLEIDYTALSLVAPEKVLFRYKLEGWDRDWQDVGTRRQAFYSNLPPRSYRFRVMACNNSGVWNEAGTLLDFFVAPAYYQTTWFRSLSVIAFLALLAALYQLRLRQVARQFNMTLEARVGERTRIARDLHDTMLQSFQGVMMQLYSVTYMLEDRPEARRTVEALVERASQAIGEGREAVQGMRSSTIIKNDLACALTTVGETLAAEPSGQSPVDFHVEVEGESRDLHPILRDEVYRIASEAVRNAFRHSGAGRIEVEICYDARQLRVRVRDNGKGIDPKVLDEGGRAGHYGLLGMHERAKSAGGKLAIWSKLDSGTEAELTIPASIAYAKSAAARRPMFWKKRA
jgi:signal transduction histidine kinase/ligand-binding sensor domain-containing protein